mgnify:CR=1 FL=1
MGNERRKVSFTLPGIPVAKKNRRRNFGNKSLPSVNYLTWEAMACAEIAQCWKGPTIAKVEQMTLHFYIDTNSRLDVDNCVTSCLDMLQKADVIIGDHWQVLPRYSVDSFESEMGRTELTIWEA